MDFPILQKGKLKKKKKKIAKGNSLNFGNLFQHVLMDSTDVAVILHYFSRLKIK